MKVTYLSLQNRFKLCFLCLLCPMLAHALTFSKQNNAYLIYNADDLAEFALIANSTTPDAKALLKSDIDFSAYPSTMIGNNAEKPYCGVFDGDGHTLKLALNSTNKGDYSAALFRFACNATFRNLRLEGSITTKGKHGASLISFAFGTCSIMNVTSSITITSNSFDDCLGGFIGIAGENSEFPADITFANCAFTGSLLYTGKDPKLVDKNGIFAHHGAGFVGWKGMFNSKIYLINCFSAPKQVTQSSQFNTFVRYWPEKDLGLIFAKNCYYASNIQDYNAAFPNSIFQGEPMNLQQFYDGEVCKLLNNKNEKHPIWKQTIGEGSFPIPTCTQFSAFDTNMFEISTEEELEHFARYVNKGNTQANAILLADIDYQGYREQIGTRAYPYEGVFDGACHKITINFDADTTETALFRTIGNGGVVKNLHVDGTIHTDYPYAGGVVSHLQGGFVGNCLSTVCVQSNYHGSCYYGGIASHTMNGSIITNCIFSGSIDAPYGKDFAYIVGLIQQPKTTIRNTMALCQADVDTVNVLFNGTKDWAVLEESFCLDKTHFFESNPGEISLQQLHSGEIFYRIWGKQFFKDEGKMEEQEYRIKKGQFYIIALVTVSLLVIIIMTIVFIYYRNKHAILKRNFELISREHELWKHERRMAMQNATEHVNTNIEISNEIENTQPSAPENQQIFSKLYANLLHLMEVEELYKQVDLDETRLAKEVGTNVKYLSMCILQNSGQPNFNAWLASYRINYLLQLFEEDADIDVMTVYQTAGFTSHSTFNRHFKNIVGMTAKQYITMVHKS